MKFILFMVTAVAIPWGNKLYELFEAILIVVKVKLVVIVHNYILPATVQDPLIMKLLAAIRFLDVIIFNEDPALVRKVGVTVKYIELSVVCIHDILFC